MDDDKQAVYIGLGAGLGGFAGLLIIGCICWQIFCGSWCEKKTVQSTIIPTRTKNQRYITTGTKANNNIATITPMKNMNTYSNSKSNDLATKVTSIRR